MKTLRRETAAELPDIGFGTYKLGQETEECVLEALRAGYRLIDTAQIYGNEKAVCLALKRSGLPRASVFVTSKVWRTKHGYHRTRDACLQSLKELGTDYIDLMLVHWPDAKRGWPLKTGDMSPPDFTPEMRLDTWRALEDLHTEGKL